MKLNPEADAKRCSVKKLFSEISQNSQKNICARVSFLIKLRAEACNVIKKETLAQVFFYEFRKISKNTFFYRIHLGGCFYKPNIWKVVLTTVTCRVARLTELENS